MPVLGNVRYCPTRGTEVLHGTDVLYGTDLLRGTDLWYGATRVFPTVFNAPTSTGMDSGTAEIKYKNIPAQYNLYQQCGGFAFDFAV